MKINGRGLFGTLLTHILLLLLLILGGLTFPDPPPEEEGILVNFGTDDTGFGLIEPEGDEANQGEPEREIVQEMPEEVSQPDPLPADPVTEETVPQDNTQDVEETPIKEEPKPDPEEIRRQQEEAERIRKEQEEAERLRQEELERQRQEEAERQRRLEEERIQQEKADRLSNLGRNTFGRQGEGEEEGSEGVDPGSGTNQGVTTGSPDADNYGDGQGLGDGVSFGLGGRTVRNKSIPDVENCEVTSRIIITVAIQVDRQGDVKLASVQSATYQDKCLWDAVVAAARSTKFNSDPNAAYQQKGWIKYTIEP